MSIATKTAGVLLATTALTGIGVGLAGTAFADSPTTPTATATPDPTNKVQGVLYTRGFNLTNLTGERLQLTGVTGDTDGLEGGTPATGTIIKPGGSMHFEMTWTWLKDQFVYPTYNVLDSNGNITATANFTMAVGGGDGSTASLGSATNGFVTDANGTTLDIKDKAGTVVTINGDQAQAQAATLKQFCADNPNATCTFTPTSETHVAGPEHVLVAQINNGTDPGTISVNKGDTIASSDSLDIAATLGTNFAGIVDASVTASYGHTWSESHEFDVSASHPVPAGYYGEITGIAPMLRDTGNFTITIGNTTFHLNGVYFDTPDTTGAEIFGYHQHALTPTQINAYPKGITVLQS